MTNEEREELIEKIAKALYEREYDKDHYPWEKEEYKTPYLGDARVMLAVAEPVIREECAEKILETNWVDANPEEIAAAIRGVGDGY